MHAPRALVAAAIAAAALVAPLTVSGPANAAPAASTARTSTAPGVLDYLCGHGRSAGHPCSVLVQRESGEMVLKVRDPAGRVHRFTSSRSAMRYLKHRVPACQQEDSNACLWDARTRGNGRGNSFIVIGRGEWVRDRSLPQYGQGVLVYLGELD